MAPLGALVRVDSADWLEAWRWVSAEPLGDHYVIATNHKNEPVRLIAVCRTDLGRDFRAIDPGVEVSPGRTAVIDMRGLRGEWPAVDPDLDYQLVARFDLYSDGHSWRLGSGPNDDWGPLFPRPMLGDQT